MKLSRIFSDNSGSWSTDGEGDNITVESAEEGQVAIVINKSTFARMYPGADFEHFLNAAKYAEAPINIDVYGEVVSDKKTISTFFTSVIFILIVIGSLFFMELTAEVRWVRREKPRRVHKLIHFLYFSPTALLASSRGRGLDSSDCVQPEVD